MNRLERAQIARASISGSVKERLIDPNEVKRSKEPSRIRNLMLVS